MPQGMRFSLFVSVWIFLLACRSSSSWEGACRQDNENQSMGDPMVDTEEVEKQMEVAYAPPSRVHDGGSNCASPASLPRRRLPMPTPPILPTPQSLPLPPILPTPQALPLRRPVITPPILPGHVPRREPWPMLFFMPAPAYFLAPAPWQRPLTLLVPPLVPMAIHLLPSVFRRAPLPLNYFMPVPLHLLAHVPRRESFPLHVPMPAPAHLLARVSTRVAMCKFLVDVEAAGKELQLLALLQDWNVNGSYPDLLASVTKLFEGHPDLLVTFNKFLPEAFQSIVPESSRE